MIRIISANVSESTLGRHNLIIQCFLSRRSPNNIYENKTFSYNPELKEIVINGITLYMLEK